MECAISVVENRYIFANEIRTYLESVKKQLKCPYCLEPVFFRDGVHNTPHFSHYKNGSEYLGAFDCPFRSTSAYLSYEEFEIATKGQTLLKQFQYFSKHFDDFISYNKECARISVKQAAIDRIRIILNKQYDTPLVKELLRNNMLEFFTNTLLHFIQKKKVSGDIVLRLPEDELKANILEKYLKCVDFFRLYYISHREWDFRSAGKKFKELFCDEIALRGSLTAKSLSGSVEKLSKYIVAKNDHKICYFCERKIDVKVFEYHIETEKENIVNSFIKTLVKNNINQLGKIFTIGDEFSDEIKRELVSKCYDKLQEYKDDKLSGYIHITPNDYLLKNIHKKDIEKCKNDVAYRLCKIYPNALVLKEMVEQNVEVHAKPRKYIIKSITKTYFLNCLKFISLNIKKYHSDYDKFKNDFLELCIQKLSQYNATNKNDCLAYLSSNLDESVILELIKKHSSKKNRSKSITENDYNNKINSNYKKGRKIGE